MKYCPKCGADNDETAKFCRSCANSFDTVTNSTVTENNAPVKESLGTASLVLGIIALVLSFTCIIIFPVFIVIPLALTGLILGIVNKVKHGKKFAGIILNALAFVISIAMIFLFIFVVSYKIATDSDPNGFFNRLYNQLEYITSENYVAGTWSCKSYSSSKVSDDYTVKLILNNNKTFVYGDYKDISNNHAGGTYTYEDEKSKNENVENGYKYFIINLDGNENDYYIDGKAQNKEFKGKFEIGITTVKTKKQAILISYSNYNMYYCYQE